MGGPAWLTAIFAAASLAVAVYCAGRLTAARRWRRPTEPDTDGACPPRPRSRARPAR